MTGASVRRWVRGLMSVTISAAAGSVAVVLVDPVNFNLMNPEAAGKLGMVAAAFALVALANYLQQHPLPDENGEEGR